MQISFSLINTLNLLSNDHFQGLQHFIQTFSFKSPNQTPQKPAHAEPEGRGESGAHRAERIGNRPEPIGRRTPFKPSICLATISQVFAFLQQNPMDNPRAFSMTYMTFSSLLFQILEMQIGRCIHTCINLLSTDLQNNPKLF